MALFDTEFPQYSEFEGQHGLVLQIPQGSQEGAQKIAETLFKEGFCEEKPESIYHPVSDIWIFIWRKGVSVDMPFIIKKANHHPMRHWGAETLMNFLKLHGGKVYETSKK